MAKAKNIYEIYSIVGQIIVDSMVYILTHPSNATKYPLKKSDNLIKELDYDISFKQRDNLGRFKKLTLALTIPAYGFALDKGRQGTHGNKNVKTNWKNGIKAPPMSAMIGFIKKRGLQTKIKSKKGKFISINAIAFILMRSIKRKGINPRNFIQPSFEEGIKKMDFYLDRDLLDIITNDIVL